MNEALRLANARYKGHPILTNQDRFFAEFNGTAQGKTQHQLIAILSLAQ